MLQMTKASEVAPMSLYRSANPSHGGHFSSKAPATSPSNSSSPVAPCSSSPTIPGIERFSTALANPPAPPPSPGDTLTARGQLRRRCGRGTRGRGGSMRRRGRWRPLPRRSRWRSACSAEAVMSWSELRARGVERGVRTRACSGEQCQYIERPREEEKGCATVAL